MDYGFRVVISSRFGEIFKGNSSKAGLLAATVEQSDVELLWKKIEERPGLELTVDLEALTITADDLVVRVHRRRLRPLAAARGPRRRRHHAALRRRHRGLRGDAAGPQADHRLTRHQGTSPASSKKPPVGPSSGRVARRMGDRGALLRGAVPLVAVEVGRDVARARQVDLDVRALELPDVLERHGVQVGLGRRVPERDRAGLRRRSGASSDPTLEDTFTIRGRSERRSSGSIAFVIRMTPKTFVSTPFAGLSRSMVLGSCGVPPVMPALLTSTSSRSRRGRRGGHARVVGDVQRHAERVHARRPGASRRPPRDGASSRAPTPTRQPRAPRPAAIS